MKSDKKFCSIHLINIRRISTIVLLICSISIIITSCKKENTDETPPSTVTDKGTLLLHLHTWVGNSDIYEVQVAGNPVAMANGRMVEFNMADMYISDIQLVKLDGTTYSIPGKRMLKVLDNVYYTLGEVPVGNYTTLRFKVGLDAATNASNPSSSPDSAILNKPGMWFGSTPQPDGYVFLHAKGQIDTSGSMSGSLTPFEYKIGTNANYIQVSLSSINLTIVKNQPDILHLAADYSPIFNSIDLKQSSNLSLTTPAENSNALAATIKNIIATQMFIKE